MSGPVKIVNNCFRPSLELHIVVTKFTCDYDFVSRTIEIKARINILENMINILYTVYFKIIINNNPNYIEYLF